MKFWMIVLFILPLPVFSQNTYTYKNLVMEGGGVRGLAYGGALEILEQKGIIKNIENVAGSSAGAIAGLMVALNYNSHEIDSVLEGLKIQEFNDGKFFAGKIRRVKKEYGLFKGDKFDKWLGDLIANKTGDPDITFTGLNELHLANKNFRNFFCTGTNVSRQRFEILSYKTWPQMKLKTAVHISSSIPFYFVPVAINKDGQEVSMDDTSQEFDLYVDGGMLCNFPINIFDSCATGTNPFVCNDLIYNKETLGLKLERGEQIKEFEKNKTGIAPYNIKSMKQYFSAVMNLVMESLNRSSPDLENEKGRTIYISYGDISGRPRKMAVKAKKILYDNGVSAAQKFFENK
jgi:NTE family protein